MSSRFIVGRRDDGDKRSLAPATSHRYTGDRYAAAAGGRAARAASERTGASTAPAWLDWRLGDGHWPRRGNYGRADRSTS